MIIENNSEIRIKAGIDEKQLMYIHPELHTMMGILSQILERRGFKLEITSMVRKKTTDSGIHETGRAVDCVARKWTSPKNALPEGEGHKITAFMIYLFHRKSGYKSCIYHDAGTGFHFHLQCDATPGWVDLKGGIPGVPV